MRIAYRTEIGTCFKAKAEIALQSEDFQVHRGAVDLIFTSPPFPLVREKDYGNKIGREYIEWFASFAEPMNALLSETGSIVIEIGNSWNKGEPTMSTATLEALLEFKRRGGFHLCQQFIWENPARLPGPTEWVNRRRIRVKDSFTNLWWMSKTPHPKASNRNVLVEYSPSMKSLLRTRKYNAGKRPSEHVIGEKSFLTNNGGAIPSNVLTASNTGYDNAYRDYCIRKKITYHPATMPPAVVDFFIKFLTDEEDLVLDPFAGSNTTGSCAEQLNRRWLSVEMDSTYVQGSKGRFEGMLLNNRIVQDA